MSRSLRSRYRYAFLLAFGLWLLEADGAHAQQPPVDSSLTSRTGGGNDCGGTAHILAFGRASLIDRVGAQAGRFGETEGEDPWPAVVIDGGDGRYGLRILLDTVAPPAGPA